VQEQFVRLCSETCFLHCAECAHDCPNPAGPWYCAQLRSLLPWTVSTTRLPLFFLSPQNLPPCHHSQCLGTAFPIDVNIAVTLSSLTSAIAPDTQGAIAGLHVPHSHPFPPTDCQWRLLTTPESLPASQASDKYGLYSIAQTCSTTSLTVVNNVASLVDSYHWVRS
jgi:hypothetical protein